MPNVKIIVGEVHREQNKKRTVIPISFLHLPRDDRKALLISLVPKDTTKENFSSKPRFDMRLQDVTTNIFYISDEQREDNNTFYDVGKGLPRTLGTEYKVAVNLTLPRGSDFVVSDTILKVEKQFQQAVKSGATTKKTKEVYVKRGNRTKKITKLFIGVNKKLKQVY